MQPFWDVFWSDAKALVQFALPMLALALPVSVLAAGFGALHYGFGSWWRLVRAALGGFLIGTTTAVALSMLVEFSLTAEGLRDSRRAIREVATWQLCLAGPLLTFLASFFAVGRYARLGDVPPSRRYTLQQLFVYQLIAALLLGWWTYTRREEIGWRRSLLQWQVRDRQAKAIFEPYGWRVLSWLGYEEIGLTAQRPPNQQPVDDETLELVSIHGPVIELNVSSDKVTDAGVARLAGAKQLRQLNLASEQISDEGVAELCRLPRLRYLEINSPRLTGAGLAQLAKIKSLRLVTLDTTLITPSEEEAFRKARPDVNLRFTSRPK
jgi:hypothetical protein